MGQKRSLQINGKKDDAKNLVWKQARKQRLGFSRVVKQWNGQLDFHFSFSCFSPVTQTAQFIPPWAVSTLTYFQFSLFIKKVGSPPGKACSLAVGDRLPKTNPPPHCASCLSSLIDSLSLLSFTPTAGPRQPKQGSERKKKATSERKP